MRTALGRRYHWPLPRQLTRPKSKKKAHMLPVIRERRLPNVEPPAPEASPKFDGVKTTKEYTLRSRRVDVGP
eukprot:649899-Pyramimonas_sp.AAC.1